MLEFLTENGGILFALLGAVLAAGLAGMGSAKAVAQKHPLQSNKNTNILQTIKAFLPTYSISYPYEA